MPADELKAAIRWHIKDLIDFHIDDATLDAFELPGQHAAGKARSMYVVAARNEAIRHRVDMLTAAEINLDIIDIPELAQRNLASLLPEDANGVVLLSLGDAGGLITITKQGEIFLSRNIDIGLNEMELSVDTTGFFDRIALEVQRSLDYFDSHFRQAPINHLALVPPPKEVPGLLEYLDANLNLSASMMNFGELLEGDVDSLLVSQTQCLMAVGAALRREEKVL